MPLSTRHGLLYLPHQLIDRLCAVEHQDVFAGADGLESGQLVIQKAGVEEVAVAVREPTAQLESWHFQHDQVRVG